MKGIRPASGVVITVAVHGALLTGLLTGLRVKPGAPQSRDMAVRLLAQGPAPRQAILPAAAPRPALPAIEPLRLAHAPVLVAARPAETDAPEIQIRPAAAIATTRLTAHEPPAQAEAITVIAADHQHCPQPDYPSLLRSKRIEGRVLLRVRVEADGRPSDVVVRQGSGWRLLDEAAAQSARRCLFRPARRGQAEFASWVEYPVSFALRG